MKEHHSICKRILNNIEILKDLEDNNEICNLQYKDSLNRLEKCIKSLYISEIIDSKMFTQSKNSLNSIKENIDAKKIKYNLFLHDLIEADYLSIKSF